MEGLKTAIKRIEKDIKKVKKNPALLEKYLPGLEDSLATMKEEALKEKTYTSNIRAFKIVSTGVSGESISDLKQRYLELENGVEIDVSDKFWDFFKPDIGGYYIKYGDEFQYEWYLWKNDFGILYQGKDYAYKTVGDKHVFCLSK